MNYDQSLIDNHVCRYTTGKSPTMKSQIEFAKMIIVALWVKLSRIISFPYFYFTFCIENSWLLSQQKFCNLCSNCDHCCQIYLKWTYMHFFWRYKFVVFSWRTNLSTFPLRYVWKSETRQRYIWLTEILSGSLKKRASPVFWKRWWWY